MRRAVQDSLQNAKGRDERGDKFYSTIKQVCGNIGDLINVFDQNLSWAEHAGIETVAGAEVKPKAILNSLHKIADGIEFHD